MSFLEELCRRKNRLKNTDTVVTQPDGRRFLESKGNNVEIEQTFGFVVDTKPDNIPAEITENLYLGSQDCCDLHILQQFGISSVLSVGIEAPCVYSHVNYKHVPCLDLPETDIVAVLENDCAPFLSEAIRNGKNVLVHCNAGVSRSSAVIIGFLMLSNSLSYKDAYNVVKLKRQCIKPNSGFEKQLQNWKK